MIIDLQHLSPTLQHDKQMQKAVIIHMVTWHFCCSSYRHGWSALYGWCGRCHTNFAIVTHFTLLPLLATPKAHWLKQSAPIAQSGEHLIAELTGSDSPVRAALVLTVCS